MVRSARLAAGACAALMGVLAGCATGDGRQMAPAVQPPPPPPTTVPATTVPAIDVLAPWSAGGPLTPATECGTDAAAPALTWLTTDLAPVEYLLTVAVDGTVQDALVGIPADATGLRDDELPEGAFWWPPTEVGRRWPGVCGVADATATFTVYALNQQLEAADDADVAEVASLAELTAAAYDIVSGLVPAPAPTPTP
jgi:hypothetical protein